MIVSSQPPERLVRRWVGWSQAVGEPRQRALRVDCPACTAKTGDYCHVAGQPRLSMPENPHRSRIDLALDGSGTDAAPRTGREGA